MEIGQISQQSGILLLKAKFRIYNLLKMEHFLYHYKIFKSDLLIFQFEAYVNHLIIKVLVSN